MAPGVPEHMICPRCPRMTYHVHAEQLSDAEHYALNYALAVVNGGRWAEDFKQTDARVKLTQSDKRRILKHGLRTLHEKWGLVSMAKDGEGEYVPAEVHTDRFVSGALVLGELN